MLKVSFPNTLKKLFYLSEYFDSTKSNLSYLEMWSFCVETKKKKLLNINLVCQNEIFIFRYHALTMHCIYPLLNYQIGINFCFYYEAQ